MDCIQMSARVGFALRSLVRPIMETITLDTLAFTRANALKTVSSPRNLFCLVVSAQVREDVRVNLSK